MKNDPRNRRPRVWPNGIKCWHIKDSDAKALLAEEAWAPDPENNGPTHDAYTNDRGELLLHYRFVKSILFSSRKEYMEDLAESRKRPFASHMLEGNLPQGPHFAEAVPSLIDELARTLKIPRDSLDNSFDSLRLVDDALKKIRPKKRMLEIPNLFPGLIAYAGEVMRKKAGGEWWINEVQETTGTIYEPYVRYGPGGRYMNPWLELYKSITEPGRVFLTSIVSAEVGFAGSGGGGGGEGGSGPVSDNSVNVEDEYETIVERVKLRGGREAYRVGVRRRTP